MAREEQGHCQRQGCRRECRCDHRDENPAFPLESCLRGIGGVVQNRDRVAHLEALVVATVGADVGVGGATYHITHPRGQRHIAAPSSGLPRGTGRSLELQAGHGGLGGRGVADEAGALGGEMAEQQRHPDQIEAGNPPEDAREPQPRHGSTLGAEGSTEGASSQWHTAKASWTPPGWRSRLPQDGTGEVGQDGAESSPVPAARSSSTRRFTTKRGT